MGHIKNMNFVTYVIKLEEILDIGAGLQINLLLYHISEQLM